MTTSQGLHFVPGNLAALLVARTVVFQAAVSQPVPRIILWIGCTDKEHWISGNIFIDTNLIGQGVVPRIQNLALQVGIGNILVNII